MLLCAGKSTEHIALLELQKSGIHVASYWTKILPKKMLEQKLHDAVRLARKRLGTAALPKGKKEAPALKATARKTAKPKRQA